VTESLGPSGGACTVSHASAPVPASLAWRNSSHVTLRHQSPVTTQRLPRVTRHCRTSRNQRKLLKTNDRVPFYPTQISSGHGSPSIRLSADWPAATRCLRSVLSFVGSQSVVSNRGTSNRYTRRLETHVSSRKQSTAHPSDRYNAHRPNRHPFFACRASTVLRCRACATAESRVLPPHHLPLTTRHSLPW
jgi:hypothetical protein